MTGIALLAIIIAIAVASTCIQNYFCKNLLHGLSDNLAFMIIIFSAAALTMTIKCGIAKIFSSTILLGVLYGVLVTCENLCLLGALRRGPMSLTAQITMSSLIIPILFAVIFQKESITLLQVLGGVTMLFAMILILNAEDGKKDSITWRWFILTMFSFLAAGAGTAVQKYVTSYVYASEADEFLLTGYATAIVGNAVVLLINTFVRKESITFKFTPARFLPLVLIGASWATISVLFLKALSLIPTPVLFPVNNGVRLLLITAMDLLFFGQKLSKKQYAGFVFGFIALILLSI